MRKVIHLLEFDLRFHVCVDQFKVIDTRRVKVPARCAKPVKTSQVRHDPPAEHSVQRSSSPLPSTIAIATPPQTPVSKPMNLPSSSIAAPPSIIPGAAPDYRLLLAWSYYLASQAAWLSPMLQRQQQGQLPPSLSTDPEAAAKFLQQAMQTVMEPLMAGRATGGDAHASDDDEQSEHEPDSGSPMGVKQEAHEPLS